MLDDPKSFTNLDLGPLLDQYSETLQEVRGLFETKIRQATPRKPLPQSSPNAVSSVNEQLQSGLKHGSKVDFDTAIATVPVGEGGALANYFVHPDYVVELQVFLLQHMEYYTLRSRSNSVSTPVSTSSQGEDTTNEGNREDDFFMLVADDLDRFATEESALTVDRREHLPGVPPQKAKVCVRWNKNEEPVVSARSGLSKTRVASLKQKHIDGLFDNGTPVLKRKETRFADSDKSLAIIRKEILKDQTIQPLYKLSGCRSRLTGIKNSPENFTLATLDSGISMQKAGNDTESESRSSFPFAVLQVRHEGKAGVELLSILNHSHLVERVRGFSIQYHAIWQLYRPPGISPPFWMPVLSRDIRKLPPPALKRDSIAEGSSGSHSAGTKASTSMNSGLGVTDSSTAVEAERVSSSAVPDQLETPPLSSFRRKRHRKYPEEPLQRHPQYWSEYDHPKDDAEGADAYVIYIDPNGRSTLGRLFDKLGGLFSHRQREEEEAILQSPVSPDGDETSDEDEPHPSLLPSYGTVHQRSSSARDSHRSASRHGPGFLPQTTVICLVASVAILIVTYILATTSKYEYATEVDAGILFAIVCSLVFAVVGFIQLLRRRDGSWLSFSVGFSVLILDAVCSGGLLAWMLG